VTIIEDGGKTHEHDNKVLFPLLRLVNNVKFKASSGNVNI